MSDCRLYLITPSAFEPVAFSETLKAALDAGDVACLQLRLKGAGDDEVKRVCERLAPVAQSRGVAFLVNDRPDLALAAGADGAHVGQDDMAVAAARKLLGKDRILGATCHGSRHLAMEASEAGADYVAFGAFFPSATKAEASPADREILSWWSEICEIPCVAIGGITLANAPLLVEAGADFLAVSGSVWGHQDGPAAAVAAFARLLAA
ncbi:MAG: thiamine phosphate synthase [Alphaproteobacteria bacterium]|nr:thiamine phosphate synthase [Alphaproteobacteria bacterium]